MKVTTLKSIEKKKVDDWKASCKRNVGSQILLNELIKKKKVSKKDAKIIQKRLDLLSKEDLKEYHNLKYVSSELKE